MTPTKKQLRKLTSLADRHQESSEYITLRDGRVLAALHTNDQVEHHVIVQRDGKHQVLKPGIRITV